METVKSLRQSGYKVRVIHTRKTKTIKKMDGEYEEVQPKGGKTRIELTNPDKSITVSAEAICSDEDAFNHKIGNQIALGRAYKILQEESQKQNQI